MTPYKNAWFAVLTFRQHAPSAGPSTIHFIDRHHGLVLWCRECGKDFASRCQLNKHAPVKQRRREQPVPFTCQKCLPKVTLAGTPEIYPLTHGRQRGRKHVQISACCQSLGAEDDSAESDESVAGIKFACFAAPGCKKLFSTTLKLLHHLENGRCCSHQLRRPKRPRRGIKARKHPKWEREIDSDEYDGNYEYEYDEHDAEDDERPGIDATLL
ncbi:uncharacterized protein UV8b_07734 [Ustilaginoidea virens]|uniref:C2H2-type domain-containing protein n=1 Tax=Ustilaginoidea virens TaxID=1159556 RepID=A0A8E5MKC1_USTVR|nr:uncharacterized protein UV8b_07734 [Ustilaginoidea virens]QUC23493.1 hypothetical protein UV8b_07734 [Ustilaginoidea virens]